MTDPVFADVLIEVRVSNGEFSSWEFPVATNLALDIKEDEETGELLNSTFTFKPHRLVENGVNGVVCIQRTKPEEPHDEYHTMSELYHYRMLYHAMAVRYWLSMGIPVVKSLRHHDGELCFDGKYFIVTAELPTGQVSNHYKVEHWDLFDVPSVLLPFRWDGHTPEVAAKRMEEFLLKSSEGKGTANRLFEGYHCASKEKAEATLSRLVDLIETYDVASVGDLHDLLGIRWSSFIHERFGWTDQELRKSAYFVENGEGVYLMLPKPEVL